MLEVLQRLILRYRLIEVILKLDTFVFLRGQKTYWIIVHIVKNHFGNQRVIRNMPFKYRFFSLLLWRLWPEILHFFWILKATQHFTWFWSFVNRVIHQRHWLLYVDIQNRIWRLITLMKLSRQISRSCVLLIIFIYLSYLELRNSPALFYQPWFRWAYMELV
jgi:hypothetical protein